MVAYPGFTESTQSTGKDETDHSSRFAFGYVVSVKDKEYVLTRRIGRGGFSEVRSGKLRKNHSERFAVKIVDLKKPKTQRIGRQPYWEIELLQKFQNSEYVIQLISFKIIEDDSIFMVLELGGQSLDTVHKSGARGKSVQLKSAYCRKRFQQCVRCVKQVHDFDILHCDVKPNNFIRVGNVLKIIDFGCATPLGPLNEAVMRKKSLGTTRFMSPEYLRDKIASKGLDVWSLGCTMFWLITGKKIFTEAKHDLRRAITTTEPDISSIAEPDANDLLSRIFAQDYKRRPSCDEILKSKYIKRAEEPKSARRPTKQNSRTNSTSKE